MTCIEDIGVLRISDGTAWGFNQAKCWKW